MRQPHSDDLRRACYHLAGHAVALYLVAKTSRSVTVPGDGFSTEPLDLEQASRQRILQEITVLLSGPVAEAIALSDYHDAGLLDVLQAATLSARLYQDGVKLAAFGMGIWHRAWRTISRPSAWRAVRHLAFRLYRERALGADDVARTIRDARRMTKEGRARERDVPHDF